MDTNRKGNKMTTTINGERVTRRIGASFGYWQTASGAWYVWNDQRGWTEINQAKPGKAFLSAINDTLAARYGLCRLVNGWAMFGRKEVR